MTARLDDLNDLRTRVLTAMDAVDADKLAPLARQFAAVIAQIAELTPTQKTGDPIDEVAARRSARRSGTAAS